MKKGDKITKKEVKIVNIIPFRKGPWGDNLSYFTSKDIQIGDILKILIKNKEFLGIVSDYKNAIDVKSEIKKNSFVLKKVEEVKEKSLFKKEFIESVLTFGDYFLADKNTLFDEFIPKTIKENHDHLTLCVQKNKIKENKETKKILPEKYLFQTNIEDRLIYYKNLIRTSFAKHQSVFIVLPTEYDINIFENALNKGIEDFVFSLYANIGNKKIEDKIEKILYQEHPVCIIGTPQYLSLPIKNLSTIILEKENRNAYMHLFKNNLDLRIFVETFATLNKTKLIVGDDILRFETIAKRNTPGWNSLSPLSFRIQNDIKIEITDKKENINNQKKFILFNPQTIENIKEKTEKKQNVFVFALRKGLATKTICNDCKNEVLCEKCQRPLVLYMSKEKDKKMFFCNKCEEIKKMKVLCDECGSWNLKPLGVGVETLYEELKKIFPNTNIIKFDKNSVLNKKEALKKIEDFEKNPGSILIATEMVFFYLKEKIPLSIITSFDSLWSLPNYKINEKIIQVILQTISFTNQKMIIETKNKDDSIISSTLNRNFSNFVNQELSERRELSYPPYIVLIKIKYQNTKEKVKEKEKFLEELFQEEDKNIFTSFLKDNMYNLICILKIKKENWSINQNNNKQNLDKKLKEKLLSLNKIYKIEINPENLF